MSAGGRGARALERALWVALLGSFFVAGYFALATFSDPARARTLHTSLDAAVPFVPEAVFAYAAVYTSLALPLFTVRCDRLFRRTALAYGATLVVAFASFAAFPVTAAGLRAEPAVLAGEGFARWGVRILYVLDPPTNLFPSVHLAISVLAALAACEARRLYGMLALAGAAVVAVAICAVKQHYAVDGFAGIVLALAAWATVLRSGRATYTTPRAWGWGGPVAYLGLLGFGYLTAWLVYRSGVAP